jgi:hypothetical protein
MRVHGALRGSDPVTGPVGVVQEAVLIEEPDVVGTEPVTGEERLSVTFRQGPVLAQRHRATYDDLADLSGTQPRSLLVDHGHLEERGSGTAHALDPLPAFLHFVGQQASGDGSLLGGTEPVRPDGPQQPGGPVKLVGVAEEHHHPAEPVREAAPRLDLVEHRRQQRSGHEHAGHLLAGDDIEQHAGVEDLVVQQHAACAPDVVRVQRLEAAGPLDGMKVEVDVVRTDRRDPRAEGVEMVQVVVDDRLPRPVGLHPRLGVAGGAGGELQEARRVFVHVKIRILGAAAGLQPRERRRPVRAVGPDADEMADGLELVLVALDVRAEAGVEDQCRRLHVVQRPDVVVHREVAVQHHPDQVVLLAAEPGLHHLGSVVGQHAHPVAARHPQIHQRRADPVGYLVELGERQVLRPGRERHPASEVLRCHAHQDTCLDLHTGPPRYTDQLV